MIITTKDGGFALKKGAEIIVLGDEITIGSLKIDSPGEYDIAQVEIHSTVSGIYYLEIEGIEIAYVAQLESTPAEKETEKEGGVDLVMARVGETTKPELLRKLISQLEPNAVVVRDAGGLASFCKLEGGCSDPVDKFNATKKDLNPEKQALVVLK